MLAFVRVLDHPLYTPRLRLEPVTRALADAARAGREAFADALGAAVPADWSVAALDLVARSSAHAWGAPPAPTRVIAVHRYESAVVGDVRFDPSVRAPREYEIGYGVARERRRQGYAVEAVTAIIGWLFDEAGAETILAGCNARNLGSIRTLRKLGFWLDSNPGQTFWWVLSPDLRVSTHA